MSKKLKIIFLMVIMSFSIASTWAYFSTSNIIENKFKTKLYQFKINSNDGSFDNINNIIILKNKITLPIPKKSGYSFLGYSENKDSNAIFSNKIENVNSILGKELYAKWTPITYNISYQLNGGTLQSPKIIYTIEDSFSLSIPTKNGYNFLGWTGTNLTNTTKNVTILKGNYGNRNYTANWEPIKYSISYQLNGGSLPSGKTNPSTYTIESNFILNNPVRTGYTFTGWSGTGLSNMAKNVTVPKGNYGNRNYKANWQVNQYTASYYVNNEFYTSNKVNYGSVIPNQSYSLQPWEIWDGWKNVPVTMPANDIRIDGSIHEAQCYVWAGQPVSNNGYAVVTEVVKAAKQDFTGVTSPYQETRNGVAYWAMKTDSSLTYTGVISKLRTSMNRYKWWTYAEIHCDNGYATPYSR